MYTFKVTYIYLLLLFNFVLNAQFVNRVEADYNIKESDDMGNQNLMLGRVYFNNIKRQVIFDVNFPEKEIIIINDTATIKCKSKEVKKHSLPELLIDFSVFSLVVNNQLEYFGLNNTPFKLTGVSKEDSLVLSTWELPGGIIKKVGKMILAQKNNKLYGLVTFSGDGKIISKQFFRDYKKIQGLDFPTRIIQINYLEDNELKRITTYKNIIVDNDNNEEYYNYNFFNTDK